MSSVVAPTCDDFPDLSAEMLTAVTKRALLAIPLTFPGDSMYDTDVLRHYESLACVGHDQYPSGKAEVCGALSDLGMSATRLSMIAENFETIAKSYGLGTVDELWDLYPPEVLMFWSLQPVVDKAAWAAYRPYHQGGEEEGGGAGGRDHQGGRKKGRSMKGRKKTKKSMRDTKYGRFPRENERFFPSATDYMKAVSQYADWDHASVEYPEAEDEAQVREEDADLGDDDDDLGDAWWDVHWNPTTKTVYHGMPITEYRKLIMDGSWRRDPCRANGELAPCRAVYFTTDKSFALFIAAFKAGLSDDCLSTSVGVVIETPLPRCRYALIRPDFLEEFARLNRIHNVLDHSFPATEVIVSGFLKSWQRKDKDNTELADVLRLAYQLAVVMDEYKSPLESIINSMPSRMAIVGYSAADVEC